VEKETEIKKARGGRPLKVAAAAVLITALIVSAAAFGAVSPGTDTRENGIRPYQQPASNFNYDFTGTLLKFILATAAGIFILLIIRKYMKPYSYHGDTDNIKVLDYKSLAPDKFIYVVEIFDSVYILGLAGGSVTKIDEIKDKELIESIRHKADKNIKGKLFSEYLQKFMPAGTRED